MRNYDYGLKGFFLHKTVETLAFPSVFYSFISWILRRRRPFTVTPKGKINVKTYLLIPYVIVLVILIVTVVIGILKILDTLSNMTKDAIVINMFWTLYFIPYLSYGILISLENPKEVRRVLFKRGDLILDQKLFFGDLLLSAALNCLYPSQNGISLYLSRWNEINFYVVP